MSRCTGHCCKAFILPFTPAELWKRYDKWHTPPIPLEELPPEEQQEGPRIPDEIHLIAPMVRLVDVLEAGDTCLMTGKILQAQTIFYTCVHLDENNNCGIYEHRPKMCRDYPYGNECQCIGCTLEPKDGGVRVEAERNKGD